MTGARVLSLIIAGIAVLVIVWGGLAAIEVAGHPHCRSADGRLFTEVSNDSRRAIYQVEPSGSGCAILSRAADVAAAEWSIGGLPADMTGGSDLPGAYRLPGAGAQAYVIHRGDDIQRRLDYASAGHAPLGDVERVAAG